MKRHFLYLVIASNHSTIRFVMGEFLGNPLMDWGNNLNYGFIFFLGFAITAAEEEGLGKVMHKGRWIYIVAGFLFSCLRLGLDATGVIPKAVLGVSRFVVYFIIVWSILFYRFCSRNLKVHMLFKGLWRVAVCSRNLCSYEASCVSFVSHLIFYIIIN